MQVVIAVLTAALVGITGWYAWQTHQMVREMRATRDLAILPKLGLTLHHLGPIHADVRVVNVGAGPAMNVDVTLLFHARGQGGGHSDPLARRWRAHLIAAGEHHDFKPPASSAGSMMELEEFGQSFSRVTLSGSMRDALSGVHVVKESIEDLSEWTELLFAAGQMWVEEPSRVMNKHLAKLVKAMESLAKNSRRPPAPR